MMFDFEIIAQFLHHLVIQIRLVVRNNPAWNPVSTYEILLDKLRNHLTCHIGVECRFHPFGEVIDSYQYEMVSVGCFQLNHSNHINSPH